jgi:arsenical pump membrane protein
MTAVAALAMGIALVTSLVWRSAWAPALGALAGVVVALAGGAAGRADLAHALRDVWRPLIVIVAIMTTSACAAELGVFVRLASWIEPHTRGPVRHAFRVTFLLSALTAAALSNDAAILLVTPVVLDLLRAVYPRRNPKFIVPFAFAVFVAAGVAPLPTGNPMNLVVASRAGIHFHDYAIHMIPVAIAGWVVAYAALAWCFRHVLADEAPALGGAPPEGAPLGRPARVVLVVIACSLASYPVLALLGIRPWVVAAPAAGICVAAARAGGVPVLRIGAGVSWELVPFVFGVLVLATALARGGVTDALASLYAESPAPLPTVGGVAAAGSAVANNHSIALVHSVALAGAPDRLIYAALVGGDLGPRLLPIGSLAGLLWLHALRRADVVLPLRTFVRVGAIVTIPSLAVSLAVLWLVT